MNNKHKIYTLSLVIVSIFLYFTYSYIYSFKKSEPYAQSTTGASAEILKEEPLASFGTSTSYYDFSYAVPGDNKIVAKSIKNKADKWLVDTNITSVKSDVSAERDFGIFEGMKYSYISEYIVIENDQYKTYLETVSEFTGGAHPIINQTSYVTVRKDNTKVLAINDIYNDNIFDALSKYTRANLPKELLKKGIDINDFAEMFKDGTSANKINWNTFYFKKDVLVIVLGQYQIGPYAIGINEIQIPLLALEKYKK